MQCIKQSSAMVSRNGFVSINFMRTQCWLFQTLRCNKWSSACQRYFCSKTSQRQIDMMARSLPKQMPLPGVDHIVVVASGSSSWINWKLPNVLNELDLRIGKGGVGKSTTSGDYKYISGSAESWKETRNDAFSEFRFFTVNLAVTLAQMVSHINSRKCGNLVKHSKL